MYNRKKIAEALSRVRVIADENRGEIIRSDQITRSDRELLVQTKWLQEIIKGWYILVRPDIAPGDSAAWYANFWDFLCIYLNYHFGDNYCLSPESSLDLHLEIPTIPTQVIVIVSKGGGGAAKQLLYDTSVLIYNDPKSIALEKDSKKGILVMSFPLALAKVSPLFFQKNPLDAEIALSMIKSSSELSETLLKYELKASANRIIGAYRHLGEEKMASDIEKDLSLFGFKIYPENPFSNNKILIAEKKIRSPYAARIESLWKIYREPIIKAFPSPLGIPKKPSSYLETVKNVYTYDAYNSLSIEGYKVTDKLISHVKSNMWDPDNNDGDAQQRNALAARGYFEAHHEVLKSLETMLAGMNPGKVFQNDLQSWYRSLFAPSMRAHILNASDLLGFRKHKVYIRNSRHIPPPHEALYDAIEALYNCLENEPHAGVRAILGHYFFVFIHPYMDGNGRLARFLMNFMLASGGYCWTVIRVERRSTYLEALGKADVQSDIIPFTQFIYEEMIDTEKKINEQKLS